MHAARGKCPARILRGGTGGRTPSRLTCAHRTLVQPMHLPPAESLVRKELPRSIPCATNTQNWKNFRNGEESQRMCSPHSLVQSNNDRRDTDDDGGRKQTGGTLMETDDNDTTEATPFTARSMTPPCQIQLFPHPRSESFFPRRRYATRAARL